MAESPNTPLESKPKSGDADAIRTWWKRRDAAIKMREEWETKYRVKDNYSYWRGQQRVDPIDGLGNRRAQINKIHPDVANQIPSLYYYYPFARVTAQPELADTPGTAIDEAMQLLQDTANHIIRIRSTRFKESTMLAMKEAFWAMGVVETGYTADFVDDPQAERPALKEQKDTEIDKKQREKPIEQMSDDEVETALATERSKVKGARFYVRHIPSNQILVSVSDKPCIEDNDWIGYWEDLPLEDVKQSKAYKNAENLKPGVPCGDDDSAKRAREADEAIGTPERVRIYKIWDLRTKEKLVLAHGHDKYLARVKYERLPLHFLRFDIDPYHFWPYPPVYSKLGPQDEYNQSREYIRRERISRVGRYTYDEDAVEAEQARKFESNDLNIMIPRKAGTTQPIEPVQQPSYSGEAIQALTLSDKEFQDVGGVGGDARIAQTKTATQAKIAEVKNQAQDSADRQTVAGWLASISNELLQLAIDNMLLNQWVAINVAPDSQFAPMEAQRVSQSYQLVTAQKLAAAANMVEWDLTVDMESLSPVSEEEKFQKWMQGLAFIGNPGMAMVFAFAPELLKYTLKLMGLTSAREQEMILGAMGAMVQAQQAQAAAAAGGGSPPATPGVSPMGGGKQPGAPTPGAPTPGGPQPGGPPGPGASNGPRPA